ncbi:MAG: AGE family epimerase/isomerase, partial [Sediminibacterium sp.]
MYTRKELEDLKSFYANQLLNDTIPFWFPKSFDDVHGGFLLMRDGDGTFIDVVKAVWIHCRAIWMLFT